MPTAEASKEKRVFVQMKGKQTGPFSIEMLNRFIEDGTVSSGDFAWHEGLSDWIPLGSIEGVVCSSSASAPPPFKPTQPTLGLVGSQGSFEKEVTYKQMRKSMAMAVFLNFLWAGWGVYYCKANEGRWISYVNIAAFLLSYVTLGAPCLVLFVWAGIICNNQIEIYNLELQRAISDGTLDAFKNKYKIAVF